MGACVQCENMAFTLRVLVVAVALVAFSQSHDAVDEVVPEFGSPSYYDSLSELYDQEISLVQKTSSADKAKAAGEAAKKSAKIEAKWTAAEADATKKLTSSTRSSARRPSRLLRGPPRRTLLLLVPRRPHMQLSSLRTRALLLLRRRTRSSRQRPQRN